MVVPLQPLAGFGRLLKNVASGPSPGVRGAHAYFKGCAAPLGAQMACGSERDGREVVEEGDQEAAF